MRCSQLSGVNNGGDDLHADTLFLLYCNRTSDTDLFKVVKLHFLIISCCREEIVGGQEFRYYWRRAAAVSCLWSDYGKVIDV